MHKFQLDITSDRKSLHDELPSFFTLEIRIPATFFPHKLEVQVPATIFHKTEVPVPEIVAFPLGGAGTAIDCVMCTGKGREEW